MGSDNDTKPLTQRVEELRGRLRYPDAAWSEIAQESVGLLSHALAEIAEMRERFETQIMADLIDHARREGELLKRAEEAEAERDELYVEHQIYQGVREQLGLQKGDHVFDAIRALQRRSGVAMLRRLREWVGRSAVNRNFSMAHEHVVPADDLRDEIDRMIREAEKPVDPRATVRRESVLAEVSADNHTTPDNHTSVDLDREGDDALRAFLSVELKTCSPWSEQADALRELCRRALGEGGAS